MVEQDDKSSTITYWVRVGMHSLKPVNVNPPNALGLLNGNPRQLEMREPQSVVEAAYQYEVETPFRPGTVEFAEVDTDMRKIINEAAQKMLSGTDHVHGARAVFLTMIEKYGKESRVKMSGGGTGMLNKDLRAFVAEHDPAMVYLDAGG